MSVKLKEILHKRMDVLFLALNPPAKSNVNGHYFSNNLSFWNLLFKSELIVTQVTCKLSGDDEVFKQQRINANNAVYGVTDLVHDIVETNSRAVSVETQRASRILKILDSNPTNKLCLMHSKVYKTFVKGGIVSGFQQYGLVGKYKGTLIYNVPFHNASVLNKEFYYKLLKNDGNGSN
ncbi:MAG: hypothetical protein EOP48_05435 [Sphingobacteriales bacterium]|nr:MAG: hypothetical protein EOP48_05435 [Sphingobacteriales bacterium]